MRNDVSCRISWAPVFTLLLALTLFAAVPFSVAQENTSAAASPAQTVVSETSQVSPEVKAVLFPFDIYNRITDPTDLDADAEWLKGHPDAHFWIQGYADVRGDIVYNLVLSYRRAQWIKSNLIKRGVSESQIGYATGWGKLYPVCDQTDSDCYQKNRRVDMVAPGLLTLSPTSSGGSGI